MSLEVKLEAFSGPLDLLLHLIEKNKVDIYDIPIVEITNQYMDYIKAMQTEDMNVMSEFLVMAATLVDIKCAMLLPKEVNEEGEEQDPRAELVQKLLEFKMYKYMSYQLKDMQFDTGITIPKKETFPDEVKAYKDPIDYDTLVGDLNLVKLHEIFEEVLKREEDKIDPVRSKYGEIEREEVDMDQKTSYIEGILSKKKSFSFRSLLEKQGSKAEIIVSFLIILELMKTGRITVQQESVNDDIMITSNEVQDE